MDTSEHASLSPLSGPTGSPSRADLAAVFLRIGVLGFGGPAGQIAMMHDAVVERRGWVGETEYLRALSVCHLLPGPEAMQLATWIGWRLQGVTGGLIAGGLFVLPGALLMLALSVGYALFAQLPALSAVLLGLKATVLALVLQALIRLSGRALKTSLDRILAIGGFIALAAFSVPFPLVVLGAGLIGLSLGFLQKPVAVPPATGVLPSLWTGIQHLSLTTLVWGSLWAAPLAGVWLWLGPDHVLWDIGLLFSKLAMVTFGGAYAVLAYLAQAAVDTFGWLKPGEMADALGLAETTPGPLILVTQHVGFLAAYRDPGGLDPILSGVLGASLTTWVTFVPCFLWIFALSPWIEALNRQPALRAGLSAISASVVGVMASLALWFGLHLLFKDRAPWVLGQIALEVPVLASVSLPALGLSLLAAGLLLGLRWGVVRTLLVVAGLALGLGQVMAL